MPKDPLEEALDEFMAIAWRGGLASGVRNGNEIVKCSNEIAELKRHILDHARWIGTEEDCACLPDSEPCTYCKNRYEKERTESC